MTSPPRRGTPSSSTSAVTLCNGCRCWSRYAAQRRTLRTCSTDPRPLRSWSTRSPAGRAVIGLVVIGALIGLAALVAGYLDWHDRRRGAERRGAGDLEVEAM